MTVAIAIGGIAAWVTGRRVAMTDMPQMIALYNGMGGGAAGAIAAVELFSGEVHSVAALVARRARRHHRRRVVLGQPDRIRQAARADQEELPLSRPEHREPADPARGTLVTGAAHRRERRQGRAASTCAVRSRAVARRHDDAADRRRGHARRDLAVQRTDGARGRVRRLRAQQRRDDHRGHRRRLGRHAADAAHGQSDESLARQRAIQRLRRSCRPPRAPAARQAR